VFRELNIQLKEKDIDHIMSQFDENGDACIEFEEFINVLSQNVDASEGEGWLFEVFEVIDQDCDGHISLEELGRTARLFGLGIEEKELQLIMEACESGEKGLSY
jgi:Ca2+-binding EF-hand superfamily protein